MNTLPIMMLIGLLLAGCASLKIHDDDGPITTAAKIAARVPLCVVSYCASELAFAQIKEDGTVQQRTQPVPIDPATMWLLLQSQPTAPVPSHALPYPDLGAAPPQVRCYGTQFGMTSTLNCY